jgi:hypothetical protein
METVVQKKALAFSPRRQSFRLRRRLHVVLLFLAALSIHLCEIRAASYYDWVHDPKLFANPERMRALLEGWQKQRPDCTEVEIIGQSWWGRPPHTQETRKTDILALHVTDESVPEVDKQLVVIAAMRVVFSTTPSVVLATAHWLLSDDPAAAETRRRQHVIFVPSTRPYYHNIGGTIPESLYDNWSWEGVKEPEENIEAAAIQRLLDTWRPDVFVDVSGRVCHKEAMAMEVIGHSLRSGLDSCFVPEIPLMLAEAAAEGGYQVFRTHPWAGHGLAVSAAPIPGATRSYLSRSWRVLPVDYAYHRNHTLAIPVISSFRESFLLMMKRLFEVGNTTWRGEHVAGYPVNIVGGSGPVILSAWGDTAAARRASRVELWQNSSAIGVSYVNDPRPNACVAVVTTTPDVVPDVYAHGPRSLGYGKGYTATFDILENIEALDAEPARDLAPVRALIARYWRGSRYNGRPVLPAVSMSGAAVRRGIVVRCAFPYADPIVKDVRLDGVPCPESALDGYTVTHGPGTFVHVAIPPGKMRRVHVVTVEVVPDRPFESQNEAGFLQLDSGEPLPAEGNQE